MHITKLIKISIVLELLFCVALSVPLVADTEDIAGFDLPVEDFLLSAGGGFLFGALAGYVIKKVMKIAAVVVGLFVAGLAYLSYKGWIDLYEALLKTPQPLLARVQADI
jgi:uncharacterized membrane protein (Fun14 family)